MSTKAAIVLLPPSIENVSPAAALPEGEVEVHGRGLGARGNHLPQVLVDGKSAHLAMSRDRRIAFKVPEHAETGLVEVRTPLGASNGVPLRVARQLSDGLHPVTSPVVSRSGMTFATISGPRGKMTPVSIVRISPDGLGTPFVSGIMNPTGLAFDPEGDLFVTSRAEGIVYRIDAGGETESYAEGLGIATGAAFDADATSSSATATAPSSKSPPTARSSSTPRSSPASSLITLPSASTAPFSSPPPHFRPTTASGPSTPMAQPAPGSAASAVRRASPSTPTPTSTSALPSTASAASSASLPRAVPSWSSPEKTSSASLSPRSAPPFSPPTRPSTTSISAWRGCGSSSARQYTP